MTDVCQVRPTNVTTLSNTTLVLPAIPAACEVVLAHDCSPQKLYTVVSSPVTADGIKSIKMFVPDFKVEVSQGYVHQGAVVKVNDVVTPVSSSRPIVISRTVEGK